MTRFLGYPDRWSAAPGERVRFMVSCEDAAEYRVDLVRLHSSRLGPDAPPFREEAIEAPINGRYPARTQAIHAGSCAVVDPGPALPAPGSFTLQAHVWPTLPGHRPQALLGTWSEATGKGFGLFLDADGALSLRLDGQTLGTGVPLENRHWYLVAGSYDADRGLARVVQIPCAGHRFHPFSAVVREAPMRSPEPGPGPFLIAAWHAGDAPRDIEPTCQGPGGERPAGDGPVAREPIGGSPAGSGPVAGSPSGGARPCLHAGHFDGKLERPRLSSAALDDAGIEALGAHEPAGPGLASLVSAWDFSRDTPGTRIVDIGPARRDGHCVNLPARAMTGHAWSGESPDWRQAPADYGAIHFHHDDLYDCGWESDFELDVPDGLPSGVYAARLRAGEAEHHLPFYARAERSGPAADIAFLAPTATYMAYANIITLNFDPSSEAIGGGLPVFNEGDLLHLERPELGLSTYDHHRDGSGVCYSSRLRPVLAMQPLARMWGFTVDMLIVDWLEHAGLGFDVITDEDLHREGEALLSRYRLVVTGSHPEYYSLGMLDALEGWLNAGGRLMYMGGNGFYWRIAFHPELPGVLEVRRAEGGIRTWAAQAGEYHMSFTGELGGMWRRQRRPPNLIAGVGFISQGFDSGAPFRRRPAAGDPRAAFIFEGIDEEVIGDYGVCLGGAASWELDCVNPLLGTPAHALVVASSEGHSNIYELVPEEMLQSHPMTDATQNPDIRADMVFFETPKGGAVFSTGSIGYAGALGINRYDNGIARLTTNVLRRFADPTPFEMPDQPSLEPNS